MQLKMLLDFLNEYNTVNSSGFQVGPTRFFEKKIVTGLVLSLNPGLETVNYARKLKSNLIISIRPLFSSNLKQIDDNLSRILFILIRNHIWLYYMNSPPMVSETLANVLNLTTDTAILSKDNKIDNNLLKIYTINGKEREFEDFLFEIKRKLTLESFRYIRAEKPTNNKIGLILNNDKSEASIKLLYKHGCDCVITENLNYFQMIEAKKLDLSVIELPHNSIYYPWIYKLTKIVSIKFPRLDVACFNSDEIIRTYR